MTHILVQHGQILVGQQDSDGSWADDPEQYDPDEAREHAAALNLAADECDRQRATIQAACAGGHDWGEPYNAQVPEKVTGRSCTRDGCHEHDEQPGWMPFAGRYHPDILMGQVIDCTGPGCDTCDALAVGKAFQISLRDAAAAVSRNYEPSSIGSAFIKAAFL